MTYFIMFIGGILGIFLHSLVKVRTINRRLDKENYQSVFVEFWKSEWASVSISIVTVLTCIFISSEYLNVKDEDKTPGNIYEILQYKIASFLKTTFVVVGYCANTVVNAFLGVTEKKLQKKADDGGVTNPLDN